MPILLYGSDTFGFENLQPLERNHFDFLKSILRMKSSTPLIMVYGEFGRFPLEFQIKTRMIKFWAKILTGKNTTISHKIYKVLLYLHNDNIYSCKWISCIQKTFQDVGLNYKWISYNKVNINWLFREVKSRLEMQFVQKRNSDIQASPKCINYRIFKINF